VRIARTTFSDKILLPEGGEAAEMLSDIAIFEPNQRGRRAFDVFLGEKARQLDSADFELARRIGKAFFFLFRCTARHGIKRIVVIGDVQTAHATLTTVRLLPMRPTAPRERGAPVL
jgi:hypothetical protein